MKTLALVVVILTTWLVTGCAIMEYPYGRCGPYGCSQQQREHGAVAAISQHEAAVKAVMSPTLMPPQSGNCDTLDHGITYAGTNGRYDVQSSGGQTCKGGPSRRAGVTIQLPGDISFEDCKQINFSIAECQIYLQKRPGGGQ